MHCVIQINMKNNSIVFYLPRNEGNSLLNKSTFQLMERFRIQSLSWIVLLIVILQVSCEDDEEQCTAELICKGKKELNGIDQC